MTKLEKLYQLIEGLKELGLPIDKEILAAVDQQEEELIQNEVIPRLLESIQSIISEIKRPVTLTINYLPDEPLTVTTSKTRDCHEELDTNHSLKSIDVEKEASHISREELVKMFNKKTKDPILDKFIDYLKDKGYKEFTSSGNPSTVYDYGKRIKQVCSIEGITLIELSKDIVRIVDKYDIGGSKEDIGKQSNNAVISALKKFNEFVNDSIT